MNQQMWDEAFKVGKKEFFSLMKKDKIDPSMTEKHGKPLFDALYGLKPYIDSDSKTSDRVSKQTQKYISSVIIPAANKSIDSFWGSLGVFKKQAFKLLTKRNKFLLNAKVEITLPLFFSALSWGMDDAGYKDHNLYLVVDDLSNYMGKGSPFVVSVLNKIESLS